VLHTTRVHCHQLTAALAKSKNDITELQEELAELQEEEKEELQVKNPCPTAACGYSYHELAFRNVLPSCRKTSEVCACRLVRRRRKRKNCR
jgi:hypothetical protein